ncbi:MAG: Nif11-like leader peptide family natural product precursor [Leptolyngbya sp.]|nr:Nif11-like leader peptide family natural product precursor [Leptolyngbya sp.]
MSQTHVVRLFRDAQINPDLRNRLNASSTPEEFVAMAKRLGYEFTVKEWQASTRFSVEELECALSEIPGI